MKRSTLEKINTGMKDIDALSQILALSDEYSVGVQYHIPNTQKHFVSVSARMPLIRPILVAYQEQLKKELTELGFEEDKE